MLNRLRLMGAAALVAFAAGCSPERWIMPIETIRLTIAPQTVRCWGLWEEMDCLSVSIPSRPNQTVWTQAIDAFTYEPGFVHEIVIEGIPIGGRPTLDSPSHLYRLKRVIRKTPANALGSNRD